MIFWSKINTLRQNLPCIIVEFMRCIEFFSIKMYDYPSNMLIKFLMVLVDDFEVDWIIKGKGKIRYEKNKYSDKEYCC